MQDIIKISEDLDTEYKNISEIRIINKNVYDIVNTKLDEREKEILNRIYQRNLLTKLVNIGPFKKETNSLSVFKQMELYQLLEHICLIVSSVAVNDFCIYLCNMDSDKECDFNRGLYSIQITTHNIKKNNNIGLSYSFCFKTKNQDIKQIIINSLGEPTGFPNLITKCWVKSNNFNLDFITKGIYA